jgi:hypothetical protein
MSLPYFNTSLIPPVGTDPTALANGNALVDRLHVAIAQLAPFDRLSDADDTLGLGGGGASAPGSAYAQLAQLFPPSTGAAASPNAGAAGAPLGGGFGTLPPGRLGGPVTPEQRQGLIDGLGRSLPDLSRGWPSLPNLQFNTPDAPPPADDAPAPAGDQPNRPQAQAGTGEPAAPTASQAPPLPSHKDLLYPGNKPIGRPGENAGIRELDGGGQGARDLFDQWTAGRGGKDITPPGHPGQIIELPEGGGYLSFRPSSKSGPPTVDVNIPGIGIRELKFPE